MPKTILESAFTLDEEGKRVAFFSDKALNSRSNKYITSIVTRTEESANPTVNIIYGGSKRASDIYSARRTITEAKSIYETASKLLQQSDESAMKMAGINVSGEITEANRNQLNELRAIFRGTTTAEGKASYRKFRNLYSKVGMTQATIGPDEGAQGVAALLRSLVGSAEAQADELLEQRGAALQLLDINEGFATFTSRVSDEAIAEAQRQGVDLATGASARNRLKTIQNALMYASEDAGFFTRVRDKFTSMRINYRSWRNRGFCR